MFSREHKSSSAFSANTSPENVYIFLIKSNLQICTLTFSIHFLAHTTQRFYRDVRWERTEITFFKITFPAQTCIQGNATGKRSPPCAVHLCRVLTLTLLWDGNTEVNKEEELLTSLLSWNHQEPRQYKQNPHFF